MRVAIANFAAPRSGSQDFRADWARFAPPPPRPRNRLFEQPHDWGFHVYAIGVYLLDQGLADRVEFWDYAAERGARYHSNGVLRVLFWNQADLEAYLAEQGPPDLFLNYGRQGRDVLRLLEGKTFRVHVPCMRWRPEDLPNANAECYLVDDERFLDARSLLYAPVVNTRQVAPDPDVPKVRDFVYLASNYPAKRHDLLLDAVRGTALSGHLHPVDPTTLDLRDTRVTTSRWNELDVVQLLRTSRIAVYPGDHTSNPAAMWECVAAGLPIVVNRAIAGGKHVVVPGVTGELADEADFRATMERVLRDRDAYQPRGYLQRHWDTVATIERYLSFFVSMGLSGLHLGHA